MGEIKILIVEDEPVAARYIKINLVENGHTVLGIVDTGVEAVKQAGELKPDLVLMDIMLHGNYDGIDAAKEIHQKFDIPVVFLTAFSDKSIIERAKMARPYGFLLKPFRESELNVIIDLVIEKHKSTKKIIEKSGQEREVLLAEIHHRVRNNMQVVCSLLSLQEKHIKDPGVREKLFDTYERIHSIALVHDHLYKSGDMIKVDLGKFSESISMDIYNNLCTSPGRIQLKTKIAHDMFINIERSIPCGLIINELLKNSIKHAFPGEQEGEILLEMENDSSDNIIIRVYDNGAGMPDDKDSQASDAMGLEIVKILTAQLDGTLEIKSNQGSEVVLKFPQKKEYFEGRNAWAEKSNLI